MLSLQVERKMQEKLDIELSRVKSELNFQQNIIQEQMMNLKGQLMESQEKRRQAEMSIHQLKNEITKTQRIEEIRQRELYNALVLKNQRPDTLLSRTEKLSNDPVKFKFPKRPNPYYNLRDPYIENKYFKHITEPIINDTKLLPMNYDYSKNQIFNEEKIDRNKLIDQSNTNFYNRDNKYIQHINTEFLNTANIPKSQPTQQVYDILQDRINDYQAQAFDLDQNINQEIPILQDDYLNRQRIKLKFNEGKSNQYEEIYLKNASRLDALERMNEKIYQPSKELEKMDNDLFNLINHEKFEKIIEDDNKIEKLGKLDYGYEDTQIYI